MRSTPSFPSSPGPLCPRVVAPDRVLSMSQVELNVVEGDPNSPFSIAPKQRLGKGATPFPGLLYFTLDPYFIIRKVKQAGIKYHFLSFGITRPGIEPFGENSNC